MYFTDLFINTLKFALDNNNFFLISHTRLQLQLRRTFQTSVHLYPLQLCSLKDPILENGSSLKYSMPRLSVTRRLLSFNLL